MLGGGKGKAFGERETMRRRLALLAMGVLLVAAFSVLAGCSRLSSEDAAATIQREYEAVIGYDAERSGQPLQAIRDGFAVEILSVDKSEGGYVVKCILSNCDVAAAFEAIDDSADEMTLSGYAQVLSDEISGQERVELETEMTIVAGEDGSYETSFTDEQLNGATGGLISYYMQLSEGEN